MHDAWLNVVTVTLYLAILHRKRINIIFKQSTCASMKQEVCMAAGFSRYGMPPPAANDTGTPWAKTAQIDHVTLRP